MRYTVNDIHLMKGVFIMSEIQKVNEAEVDELRSMVESLIEENETLKKQLESIKNGAGRKQQVLDLLNENGKMSITQIAEALSISTKNVSSQLTYLRSDGYSICTDAKGYKFILED